MWIFSILNFKNLRVQNFRNVLLYRSNLFRTRVAAILISSDLGFRQLSSEKGGVDFEVLTNLGDSEISLGPVSKSFWAHKQDQSKCVFSLSNAIIEPMSSYVFDSEGRLIGDSISWSIEHAMLRWTIRPKKHVPVRKKGEYLFLGHQAFYHWLIEDFSSYLLARRERPDLPTLVFRTSPRYVFAALRILGATYESIERTTQVETLFFASKGAALQPHTVDIAALNDFALSNEETSGSGNSELVYISRVRDGRIPDNELQVEEYFRLRGFSILTLSDLDFASQVTLFKGAKVIAGTHGAGLSNIVWSPSESAVIEIMRTDHPLCFKYLTQIRSQQYFSVASNSNLEQWIVSIEELDSVFEQLLQ
jgi:hypothetical protein